jgi:hypothetical protein
MTLQHPVPALHLQRIGDITVSFAMLESQLQKLVATLLGAGQFVGEAVTAELSFRALRGLIVSLHLEKNGEDENWERLELLIKRAAAIEELRNGITHSVWAAGVDADSITRIKLTAKDRKGRQIKFETVTAEQLAALAADIKLLAYDFMKYDVFIISGIELDDLRPRT